MKWRNISKSILLAAAVACLWVSACGGGNKANQVVVQVSPAGGTLVVKQEVTFTAIVTGATDVSSTFDCSFTTTPNATTADPNPKASTPAACTSVNGDVGALGDIQNTSTTTSSTAKYTAPSKFPDPTKYINLQVIITATAKADTKKTGQSTITIDSGIRIQIVPTTATLATGEKKQFFAEDLTGAVIPNTDLKWDVTADATATTKSVTCTPTCGTVDNATGIYTAPSTVPTQATATIFAVSKIDPVRGAQAAITIVKAGDITFSGISPSVVSQGARQQDIFLAATNATSQIGVTLKGPCGDIPLDQQNQIKVVFAAGATSSSIGARIRLSNVQLTVAGNYQVQVTSSNPSVNVTGGPFPLDVIPVRPTIVSSVPDNLQESTLDQNGITIDGGYFGTSVGTLGTCTVSPTITPLFNNTTSTKPYSVPTARRITGFLPAPSATNPNSGLFPLSVKYTTSPGPFAAPSSTTAYTNISVIPDYSASNPATLFSTLTLPAASKPSGIALDSLLGRAVVTLAGLNTSGSNTNTQNNVQFINLAGGTPTLGAQASSGGNVATAVAIDDQLHVAAVVNYGSRTLSVLSIPSGALVATIDLSSVIPPPNPLPTNPPFVPPFPYSVGIDPFSHRAVVAFASTNVGLIINLDPNFTFNSDPTVSPQCILPGPAAAPKYCPIGYVTLASGSNPQVAFEPGARLAYVTPGGQGLLSAVDLANPSKGSLGIPIVSATRASNVVTIKTSKPHNLVPGDPGTVLISGLPPGTTNNTNFNGSFAVGTVLDANNFQYVQAAQDDVSTCTKKCLASSGVPFLTYTVSPSIAGIAINPITRLAVLADTNTTFGQIAFLDPQSQSVTSMTVFAGATGQVSSGSPELGATNVAFQPFTNTAVSLNPALNQVSLLDPTALQRLAIISTGQNATASVCAANCGSTTPPPANVSLTGALGMDSVHNLAFAVNSGSNNISVLKLGTIKPVHIQQVLTPAIDAPTIPVPAQLSQAVKITSGVAPAPVGPVRILGAGFTNPSQVRLDGVALPTSGVTFISSEELDVTIPVTMPNPSGPNPIGILTGPRHFALDVVNNLGIGSNVMDFTVVEEVPIPACSGTAAAPGGVAIDELHNIALVTNTGCHQVSAISLDPANNFGTVLKAIQTGGTPTGVAVLPRLVITGQAAGASGVAVVTNNSANTVTILDLASLAPVTGVTDIAVGTAPSGVAINPETNLAVIANTGSNSVSTLDLTPLTKSPIGSLAPATVAVNQNPIAVAIDPDRGTNGRGLAVVTTLQLNGASTPFGALDAIDIGGTVPVKSSSASISGLLSTPTGIVFDPAVSPGLFYATSTQGNQITAFNPSTNGTSTIKVGINPTAIAYNFQSSTILTVNALSNSISIVDSQTFRTKATLGIGGNSRFSTAIHTLTNLAVIADQANNRVLLFPVPK